jgi:hypothetical protein
MNKNCATFVLGPIALMAIMAQARAGDIVVVMGPGAVALIKDKVANVYLGRNHDLKPMDMPESSPIRVAFYKKAADGDLAQIKSVWARLVFTAQGQPPKELADADAIKKAVATDPKAVGYIDKADVDASVKVVLTLN